MLKRRLVKRPPTARPEEVARRQEQPAVRRQEGLRQREQELARLRQQRRQLAEQEQKQLRRQQSPRQESPRQLDGFRSLPSFTPASAPVGPEEPYITRGGEGSYTISY